MVISGVGRVEQETRHICKIVEATMAEARSVRDKVESRVASLVASADPSALRAVEEIMGSVKEVVAYSDAQALCVTAEVMQRLESKIAAVALSATATADITTRTAGEGMRRHIQVQIEQICVDALQREQEAQRRVEGISTQLQTLTMQINKFRPASEHVVGVVQDKVSKQLQQRFDAQSERIDQLSAIVVESQKQAQTNANVL